MSSLQDIGSTANIESRDGFEETKVWPHARLNNVLHRLSVVCYRF